MTFPSTGCQTCRTRRIKCDEAQPVCHRCMKSRRICHGMRAGQACSVVHSENSYASGQKKRPRGPRSTATAELNTNQNIVTQPSPDNLETQAIAYYMHHYLQTRNDTHNISKCLSDDFLPIWISKSQLPILDFAVSSTALAMFSQTKQYPPAAIEASMKYQRLLRITQVAILSLNAENIDASLFAIYLMGRYEHVVHRPSHLNPKIPFATTVQSFSHHDGSLAILKLWKDHLSFSQPATDVIKHTRRSMIRSALLRNLALPEWILEGAAFGEHGLELEYDRSFVRILNLRQRLGAYKGKTGRRLTSSELATKVEELNEEARDLDKALQDWTRHFPSTWSFQRHTLSDSSSWPTKDFYSPKLLNYSSPAYAAVWNQYYSTRMLINSTRLRILEHGDPIQHGSISEQRLECLSLVKVMGDNLASSVPSSLQRFKATDSISDSNFTLNTNDNISPYEASLTVWPLTIASSLEGVDVKQKSWFRSELVRLGTIVGDRVLECAETDQWLEL